MQQNKRIHRPLALLAAALLLALSLAIPSTAATPYSITINQPGQTGVTLDGKTYSIWKIFDADLTDPAVPVYTPASSFTAFFAAHPAYTPAALSQSYTLIREMGIDLKTWIPANSVTADDAKTGNTLDPIVFDNLDPGYYFVGGAIGNANGEVVTVVQMTNADSSVVITPKGSIPTMDMQVHDFYLNPTSYPFNGYGGIADAQIGENVQFRLTISNYPTLEQMRAYGNYYVTAYVSLDNGLIFENLYNPPQVYCENNPYFSFSDDAPVSTTSTNGATFKVTIPLCLGGQYPTTWNETLKNLVADQYPIVIDYSAFLSSDAVIYDTANPETSVNNCTAVVTYNNDHSNSTSVGQTAAKSAKVLTYAFDATKVDSVNHSQNLEGASFELSYYPYSGNPIPLNYIGSNIYVIAGGPSGASVSTVVTDASGKFYIRGLDSDRDYYLVETIAPDGYDLPEDPVTKVKFHASTTGIGSTNLATLVLNVNDVPISGYSFLIENGFGTTLPSTGGMGTVLFTVGGAALIGAAVVLFVTMRKRRLQHAA